MTGISRILLFMVSCVFTQNVVFTRLLGGCALGEERRISTAAGLGIATAVVMALASGCTWIVDQWLLQPLHAGHLQILAFVAVIVVLSELAGFVAAKLVPALGEALRDSSLAIAANCAVLGVALLNVEKAYSLGDAILSGLFCGLGFLLAIVCMAGVQERLEGSNIPRALRGFPISLISASLMALAFMGFLGIG